MLIDSHAHLQLSYFDDDREKIIESLIADNKISKIINIGIDVESGNKAIELAERYNSMYATVGIHPCDLNGIDMDDLKEIRTQLSHEKVMAIGEIGLDYYHDQVAKDIQKKYFIKQLEMALEEDYPVVIHNREADEDIFKIISEVNSNYKGVFHCYAGNLAMAEKLMEMGFYLSFNGTVTFKNSDRPEIVKNIPLDKILLETDCPFLTPVPFRGKKNDPGKLIYVAQKIAELKNISFEEVASRTTVNSEKLFKI